MIRRVLINLMENAMQVHARRKARSRSGAKQEGKWLQMWVQG